MNNIHTTYISVLADLFTPVGLYNKLRDHYSDALLLECADYHERADSKSFICIDPIAGFEAKGKIYQIHKPNQATFRQETKSLSEVFSAFKKFVSSFNPSPTDLDFNTQGVWGFSSFESVQYMEDITFTPCSHHLKNNPDLKYQLFRYVLVFDHFKNQLHITQNEINTPITSKEKIFQIIQLLKINNLPNFSFEYVGTESSNITDDKFKAMVSAGINHCKNGDTFQVVLSREFQHGFKGDDFNLYRSLRSINPSPFLFYFDYGDFKIMGSSPESQLQVSKGIASINPIAGTALRGKNKVEDEHISKQLKENAKEISEHVMLVDLARNDLSKNSKKVEIDSYAEIQYFSHVIHMVSKVKGELFPHVSGLEVYADTFPAGTLSGAPKYRALEIINEQETVPRNFYGGAIGFIGFDQSVNHAIIIRSILSKNNTLVYQAGAGIVSSSTPEGELQEVNHKISAIRKAIQKANKL